MSCSEWNTVKLKDITTDGKGYYGIGASAVEYDENLLTYLRITDITDDGRIIKDSLKSVNDKDAENYILKENDIVFARTGNSTGRSYFYEVKDGILVFAGFLIKFNLDKNKVNPKFIRYYTLTDEYKNWVESFSTGSTRKNINAKMYGEMEITLPPRNIQDSIVELMDSLEDKIELNNEMNKTLEEMAQSIFKRWFVDFEFPNKDGEPYKSSGGEMVESELGMIPKGWEVKRMKEISKLMMGISPKSSSYNNDCIGVPLLNGAADFDNGKINPAKYTTDAKRICSTGDIILSIRGTIGNLNFSDNEYCLGRSMCALRGKEDIDNMLIFMYILKSIEQLKMNAIGSVIVGLSKPDIEEIMIAYPNYELRKLFSEQLSNLYFRKKHNISENENLKCLRDVLITRLMNGDISVV